MHQMKSSKIMDLVRLMIQAWRCHRDPKSIRFMGHHGTCLLRVVLLHVPGCLIKNRAEIS
jgi:hypothetical protein